MSVVRGFGLNGKSYYTNVVTPKDVFLSFTVSAADTGGFGTTSVKSNGYIENVFMHTSQTPGTQNGFLNPNPPNGYALVRFKSAFNYFLNLDSRLAPPATSTTTTSTTANSVYVITALGTATLAQWQTRGLPVGLTPTVGQAFVAITTGTIGGSATVGVPGIPTTSVISIVGDPKQTITNSNIASNAGATVVLQFAAPTNSSTTTLVAAAPADNTIVYLKFSYDGSSVTIDGI